MRQNRVVSCLTSYRDHLRSGSFFRKSCATVFATFPTVVFQKLQDVSIFASELRISGTVELTTTELLERRAATC